MCTHIYIVQLTYTEASKQNIYLISVKAKSLNSFRADTQHTHIYTTHIIKTILKNDWS